MTTIPSEVGTVISSLESRGALTAVGGSGLLLALGLVGSVRDWDLTTDAPTELVEEALRATNLPFGSVVAGDGPFASRARFRVVSEGPPIDLIVGFALRTDDGRIVCLPTKVAFKWEGLPMASPRVWAKTYRLLDRPREADLLDSYLAAQNPLGITGPERY